MRKQTNFVFFKGQRVGYFTKENDQMLSKHRTLIVGAQESNLRPTQVRFLGALPTTLLDSILAHKGKS